MGGFPPWPFSRVVQTTTNLSGGWLEVSGTATHASAASVALRLPWASEFSGFYRVRVITTICSTRGEFAGSNDAHRPQNETG